MIEAETHAAYLQAEAEVDRLRRRLERQRRLFEAVHRDDPRRSVIINDTSKLLEQYHAADAEADRLAGALQRLRNGS